MRRLVAAGVIALTVTVAACGTDGVAVEEPIPDLFEDEADVVAEETTTSSTTTTTIPVAERLPALAADVPGVVVTPTGVVAPLIEPTPVGWRVLTPCRAVVGVEAGTQVAAAHVVIDPGHGGSETGAVGAGGLTEAALNLDVAQRTAAALEAQGVSVVLTRTTDIRMPLTTRADIARSVGAQAFVSIHHNADPDGPSEEPGTEVWYQIDDPESRRLSGLVYEEAVGSIGGLGADWVADDDAGVKYRLNQRGTDYYGILRESVGVPAALAELAFLSNPAEEALLATDEYRDSVAAAVADGIIRFLVTPDEGSGFVEPYERVEPAGSGGGSAGCVDPALG